MVQVFAGGVGIAGVVIMIVVFVVDMPARRALSWPFIFAVGSLTAMLFILLYCAQWVEEGTRPKFKLFIAGLVRRMISLP